MRTDQQKEKRNERERLRYLANKEKRLTRNKQYYEDNKDQIAIKNKQYREENKDRIAEYVQQQRHRKYGLGAGEISERTDEQNGCCAICRKPINGPVQVDHCHTTGEVRGLLCRHCNLGLGHFKDSIEYLKNAIAYLTVYLE